MLLLNPRRTRTNMKLLQLVWIFLLTLCGQSGITAMTVKEDDDIILDCSFGATNIENGAFDWVKFVNQERTEVLLYANNKPQPGQQFVNRVSHFPEQLRFGNASIKITKAKTSDSGTYTCYHATVRKEVKSTISLTVDHILKPRPEIEGAAPEPSVIVLAENKDWSLLQCEVRGAFPKPEVVWKDSDGKILPADEPKVTENRGKNKFDTVLNVTVTKTDYYTCVATQKEIYHQINRTTFVHFNGGASEPSVTNLGETKDGVLLQCIVRGASPELKVFWTDKSGELVPSKEQKIETGGGYDIILHTNVTKTDYYVCVTTEGKQDDEVHSEIFVRGPEAAGIGVGTVVAVGVILLIVGIVIGCFARHFKSKAGGSSTDRSIGKNESQAPLKQDV